jgi:uncharacterized protein
MGSTRPTTKGPGGPGQQPSGEELRADSARSPVSRPERGGRLLSPSRQRLVDSPEFPQQYNGEALAQAEALEILGAANGAVDWSYAGPPPVHLVDRERTGRYRVRAGDLPIADEQGDSRISVADYAAAIVDTLESGRFVGARFTAAYRPTCDDRPR